MHSSLAALAAFRQFVVFKAVPSTSRPGKTDKFPSDYRTGYKCDSQNPVFWTDFNSAQAAAITLGSDYGVAFVFTENDPFWFLDIDGCLIDGQWSEFSQQLCARFPGCFMEVSRSGTGLHIIGCSVVPDHGCTNKVFGIEFYHKGRICALGQDRMMGSADVDASEAVAKLVADFFPVEISESQTEGWTDGPSEDWNGPTDDNELFRRAMQSRSANSVFGGKASFADLWMGNETVLAVAFPDPGSQGRAYGASEADAALAQHLAFWTGRDCERVERLMRQSALVRDKWDSSRPGGTYLTETISRACNRQQDVLQDKSAVTSPIAPPSGLVAPPPPIGGMTHRGGNGYMGANDQVQFFQGCIYVRGLHKALLPDGSLLKPEQFKVQYGGYLFTVDLVSEKTSRDAWECFTQSQVYKPTIVDGTCFRPDQPLGAISEHDGQRLVNTFVPVTIKRVVGDPAPFLKHLKTVLPDERDALILLSYMAACVQYQGVKFQWAPLLQGVEGNGKTLFSRCVAQAIGNRYSHFPPASEIGEKFNSWLFDNIFIGVEDIYVPHQKQEVFEVLKPMITSDYMAKRAMQTDQQMRNVVANFIFNSNHKSAMPKTKNDRRICALFCAQQRESDLERDGMVGDYFPDLYDWLKLNDGYAIVAEFLYTFAIPAEFNPAGDCQRAPNTTSTAEAIAASAGQVEQEIEEAISQGLQGFCGGWISSLYLARLLEGMRIRLSPHKRKEILEGMGYAHHPALPDGRTNNPVIPDGMKVRLFVHRLSSAMLITEANQAAKHYETANVRAVASTPFAAHR